MKKISLRNHKNKKIDSELVRYFKCQNDDYLIYTFGEKDEKDFIKLYVVKVMEELGRPVAKTLSTDQEWEKMQMIVKQMLKELKRGQIQSFVDLEDGFIHELKVLEARSFKLSESLVEILSGDRIIEKSVESNNEKSEVGKLKEVAKVSNESGITPIQNSTLKQASSKIDMPIQPVVPVSNKVEPTIPKVDAAILKEGKRENIEKELRDKITIQKLQQENELLKKQLLQYRIKYQALKDLITKDE